MGKRVERVFKKKLPKPNAASHNNTNWYIDTDEFLEHSLSRGSVYYKGPVLQKIVGARWVPEKAGDRFVKYVIIHPLCCTPKSIHKITQ